MKFAIAIVAFAAAFILSTGIVRILQPEPVVVKEYIYRTVTVPAEPRKMTDIEEFVFRDAQNGNRRYYSQQGDAARTMEYWRRSSDMDASTFPADFREAWDKHMQAWKNYADYLSAAERGLVEKSSAKEAGFNSQIDDTWSEVIRIGRGYGADIE